MKTLSFSRIGRRCLEIPLLIIRNPFIVLSSLGALFWMLAFSMFFQQMKSTLPVSNAFEFWLWSIVVSLLALAGLTFFFSFLFVFCRNSLQQRKNIRVAEALRFWSRMYLLSIFLLLVYVVVSQFAHYGALFLGEIFQLSLPAAQGVFILLYAFAVMGFALFFVYTPSIVVVEEASFFQALRKSWKLTQHLYLPTLVLSIGYFLVTGVLERAAGELFFRISLNDLLLFLVVYPFIAILLTAIVLDSSEEER